MNDQVWGTDSGYITTMSEFPIKAFGFGDLGEDDEAVKLNVGPMLCEGRVKSIFIIEFISYMNNNFLRSSQTVKWSDQNQHGICYDNL